MLPIEYILLDVSVLILISIFFVTLTSALLQGWSIPIAARLLRVSDYKRPEINITNRT